MRLLLAVVVGRAALILLLLDRMLVGLNRFALLPRHRHELVARLKLSAVAPDRLSEDARVLLHISADLVVAAAVLKHALMLLEQVAIGLRTEAGLAADVARVA